MRKSYSMWAMFAFVLASPAAVAGTAQQPQATEWEVGPIIGRRNFSVGLPLHPTRERRGWSIDFPHPSARAGHLHAITRFSGSLAGKRMIVMRYRVDAAPGTQFVPQEQPDMAATISLYFQRRGDNWTARGRYASYRWYAPPAGIREIRPGEFEMRVSLGDNWTSVLGRPRTEDPRGFHEALMDAERIGIAFGSTSRRAHGVFATRPARLTVLSFQVH